MEYGESAKLSALYPSAFSALSSLSVLSTISALSALTQTAKSSNFVQKR